MVEKQLETIKIRNVWQELKKAGAKEEEKEEKIAIGYRIETYRVVNYKGLEFEIRQEEHYDFLSDKLEEDNDVFLVNYHPDFWVTKDNIITEEETAKLYRGEKNWEKTEREKGYWIFELSCLIHGRVWLQLGGGGFMADPGGWDTSHVGLVLVSKKLARTRKKARQIAKDLVDYWNKLLSGDVYHITVKKNGKIIDKIGGIVGELEIYNFIKEYKI